ncbi:MAG TPA: hypothetical protein VGP72_29920 [Planctomycetota bacterium]|jgi:hypothetical protein
MLSADSSPTNQTQSSRTATANIILIAIAWLAAWAVYNPVIGAKWFYDDSDYILGDPRLDHLELFLPAHWSSPPPPIPNRAGEELFLPGYNKPMIGDRYLWHLSLAVEKHFFGDSDAWPRVAHAVNLFLHLACVTALFWALTQLLRLYRDAWPGKGNHPAWDLLPGIAALIFAVHPWAAEPVCYITARNGSMGALFGLVGLGLWVKAVASRSWLKSSALCSGAFLCALAAVGSKENFITVPAGYVLVTWPVLWQRLRNWSRTGAVVLAAGACAAIALVASLGIHSSDRAAGLWAQAGGGRGWDYFFHIQNPLLLLTLGDHISVQRMAIETGHPGWPVWACAMGLALNVVLLIAGTLGGYRVPLLLGLGWFYLHLIPTNSFLPRPDFLAARNVYLPTAGVATLLAGAGLWIWSLTQSATTNNPQSKIQNPKSKISYVVLCSAAALWLFWAVSAGSWARAFLDPQRIWSRTAQIAPEHAAARLNLAAAILSKAASDPKAFNQVAGDAEQELKAALAAEDSPTMQYHTERPKLMRRSMALRMLGVLKLQQQKFLDGEAYLRQSWAQMPTITVWIDWANACVEGQLTTAFQDVLAAGLERWPGQWWPLAMRGLSSSRRFSPGDKLPGDVRADLEAAAKAPDQAAPMELRSLQGVALYQLALFAPARVDADAIVLRLKKMGVPAADLRQLLTDLESKFPPPGKPPGADHHTP